LRVSVFPEDEALKSPLGTRYSILAAFRGLINPRDLWDSLINKFRIADCRSLPLPPASFSRVTSAWTLRDNSRIIIGRVLVVGREAPAPWMRLINKNDTYPLPASDYEARAHVSYWLLQRAAAVYVPS